MPTLLPSNVIPEVLLSVAGVNITTSYVLLDQLTAPIEMIIVTSILDGIAFLSFDGVHDHVAIGPVLTAFDNQNLTTLNFKRNLMTLPVSGVYIRAPAAVSGSLYFSSFSAQIN